MKRRLRLINLRCSFLLWTISVFSTLQAQSIDVQYPAESLKSRIERIAETCHKNIVYDSKLLDKIEVPSLKSDKADVEHLLSTSLATTGLIFKKMEDGSIIIRKETQTNNTNTSSTSGSGQLKGRIVEAETSEPIIGAIVKVSGTQLAVISDENGYYTLSRVPSGRQTVEVSYMGFKTERIETRVDNNKTANYDIKMSGDSQLLNEVVVSGIRKQRGSVPHMTEKVLVQEIKALSVVASGISSEQISKTADRNAAEVVKKISGVSVRDDKFIVVRGMNERYNLTYLNDNVAPSTELYSRAFALNLLPTRVIDKILVYKTPSPDMMGDMAGGAVKIYTKDAVAVKHFDVEFNLGIRPTTVFKDNFFTYEGGKTDFLGFDDGTRVLPSVVPGYGDFTRAKISQKQYAKSFSSILQYRKKTALPNLQLTLNYYNAWNLFDRPLSMLSFFSYKNESKQNEVARSQRAYSRDDGGGYNITDEVQSMETAQMTLLQNFSYRISNRMNLRFKNFLLQQGESNTVVKETQNLMRPNVSSEETMRWVKVGTAEDDKNIVLSYTQRFLYSGNLTGNIAFDDEHHHEINWNIGYIFSLQQIPDQRQIRLKRKRTGFIYYPADDLHWLAAVRSNNPEKNDVDGGIISRTWTQNAENAQDASLDYTGKLFSWLTLKVGTYYQWKKRELFRRVYTVNEGDLNDMGYASTSTIGANSNYMDYDRVFFKEQDLGQLWSSYYLNDEGIALKVFDRTRGSDAYTATEQSNSGYAAVNLQPFDGKVELYGGVRAEYNHQRVAGAIPEGTITNPTQGGVNYPILINNKKLSWLPSVNLSLKPRDWVVLRGAYGKTVNRPEFRELSPYSELDYLNNQVIYGNSELVSSDITGYDVRGEFYFGSDKSNLVSIGAFYKKINHPIERILTNNLSYGMPASITFDNMDNAKVKGLELEVAFNLDFIHLPFIRNLSLSGNYSRIKSEVFRAADKTLPEGTSSTDQYEVRRQLQGQAPYMFNAGIYYENPSWGTKISFLYNTIGERIYAAAIGTSQEKASEGKNYPEGGYSGSLIELSRRQLDFSFTQRISKGLQVKFSVQNLLNEAVRIAEDQNFTNKYEPMNVVTTTTDGSIATKITGDNIANEYKNDRFFNLAISYSF